MWEKVESRSHTPTKIFPFGGAEADEVMIYGVVKYGLKAGGESEVLFRFLSPCFNHHNFDSTAISLDLCLNNEKLIIIRLTGLLVQTLWKKTGSGR